MIDQTAAKSALTSVSKNLAKTLAKENILVNTVSPGTFLSGGVKAWLEGMAAERGIDPTSLEDLNRIIAEDFGEPWPCRCAVAPFGRSDRAREIGEGVVAEVKREFHYLCSSPTF